MRITNQKFLKHWMIFSVKLILTYHKTSKTKLFNIWWARGSFWKILFLNVQKKTTGLRSLFNENYFKSAVLSALEKEKLIELKTDSSMEVAFLENKSLIDFWAGLKDEYPELSYKAFNVLLPFTSTILTERAFLSYTLIKNK